MLSTFFSKFWLSCEFFTSDWKNSSNKVQKARCYGVAWLFLFKMSHHTSLSVNIHGDVLILVPYSRGLGERLVTVAQMHVAGLFFRNLPLSSLDYSELLYADLPVSFSYYMIDTR